MNSPSMAYISSDLRDDEPLSEYRKRTGIVRRRWTIHALRGVILR